ncbi:Eukaryotic translation initiation factor 3 subunit C [Sarcoptes scabiei]|nr:Eukaryotic translation initiation factor 3 subunit C [Sarcoptes scabiei]
MLLEIPEVASNEFSVRKKLISRSFFNQLRKNEEQPLVGVPEAMREHVVSASKAMRVGNWKQCQDYIINDKMNARVWNFFYNSEKVLKMLSQKIREESLRTYLFTYSFVYDSISIDTLANMFDLEANMVHSIISKMIINEELMASMDEPTRTVVMHRTEPSRIQSLALQLADKVNTLLDYNERLWELKLTPLGHFNQGARFDRGFQNRQGNRQNRQNRQNFGDRQHYRKQGNRNQGQRDRDREQQQQQAHQQSQQ